MDSTTLFEMFNKRDGKIDPRGEEKWEKERRWRIDVEGADEGCLEWLW